MFNYMNSRGDDLAYGKIVGHVIAAIIIIMLFFGSFGTVNAGERGVKTRLGAIVGVVNPGFYLKMPFLEHVYKIDIRTRSARYDLDNPLFAASRDLQDVQISVVVNFHIDPAQSAEIYQQYGSVDVYEANVVHPTVQDTIKSVASNYTAEELVTKRADYKEQVTKVLSDRLAEKSVIVEKVDITNFQFSKSFGDAIEAKVTAVQNAEAARNKLEQVKAEAQQTVEKAKADAEAIRIQAQAITQQGGAEYVNLQRVNKWDGHGCTQYCGLDASTGLLVTGK